MLLEMPAERYGRLTAEAGAPSRRNPTPRWSRVADRRLRCRNSGASGLRWIPDGWRIWPAMAAGDPREHIDCPCRAPRPGWRRRPPISRRLRSEGAAWAAVARQAEALAGLEADKEPPVIKPRWIPLLARMATASAAVEAGEPPARPGPETRKAPKSLWSQGALKRSRIRPRRSARADAVAEEVKAARAGRRAPIRRRPLLGRNLRQLV